jgi:hypothetical protein
MLDRPSQSPGFDSNDGVLLGIEISTPFEGLDGNRVALEVSAFTTQRRLYDKSKESRQSRTSSEALARHHPLERGADFRPGWILVSFVFRNRPACVKTPTSNLRVESLSRLR